MNVCVEELTELLDSTLELAEESGCTARESDLVEFLIEYLPVDILRTLGDTLGCPVDDETVVCKTIFEDRYAVADENKENEEEEEDEEEEEEVDDFACKICDRVGRLTRHHLFPRELHQLYLKRNLASKEELNCTIGLCTMCHKSIHRFWTNKELAQSYNTLEAIQSDERVMRYAAWASKQTSGNSRVR
jgi:hypothetical protein